MKIEADPILFFYPGTTRHSVSLLATSETVKLMSTLKYSNSKNQVSMQDVDTTATMRLIFSLPTTLTLALLHNGDMFVFYTHAPYLYTFICMCISYRASRMMMMRLLMMMPSDNFPRPQLQLGQHHQNVQSQPFLLSLTPSPSSSPSPLLSSLPSCTLLVVSMQTRQPMPRLLLVYRRSSRYTHDKTDTMPRGKKTLKGTSHYESK